MIFENDNPQTNGEHMFVRFLESIGKVNIIFDVGCRYDSEFINVKGTVHYFHPLPCFIEELRHSPVNYNLKSIFNPFGLSDISGLAMYYPNAQSFINRPVFCNSDQTPVELKLKRGDEYMISNNIENIDFLKIDTEGYELKVMKGFGEKLKNNNIIQFEYGGTYKDSETTLRETISYLEQFGFCNFSYLTHYGTERIIDFTDHYRYCNIVCINKNLDAIIIDEFKQLSAK